MPGEELHQRDYRLMDTTIRLRSNSISWLNSMNTYLALPPCNGSQRPACINLDMLDVEDNRVNQLIPMPGDEYEQSRGILRLNRDVTYYTYVRDTQKWIDYTGYGRLWFDRSKAEAQVIRFSDNGIDPLYTDIVFGFNTLVGLLLEANYYSIHASCIQVHSRGVLFTGKSGSGKSTAAFAMLRQGWPILSDDRTLIKKRGTYLGVSISDVIKLKSDTVRTFFPELLDQKPLRFLDGEYYFKASSTDGMNYVASTGITHLFIFERTGKADTFLERVTPAKVVGDLFPVTLHSYDPQIMTQKFTYLMDFLEQLICYKVYFGTDMERFSRRIEEAVGS